MILLFNEPEILTRNEWPEWPDFTAQILTEEQARDVGMWTGMGQHAMLGFTMVDGRGALGRLYMSVELFDDPEFNALEFLESEMRGQFERLIAKDVTA